MKALRVMLAGLAAAAALCACSKEESQDNKNDNGNQNEPEVTYDEAYYASNATISSSDPDFTANDGGGTVAFAREGGEVTVNVSCGTEWLAECSAADDFSAEYDNEAGTLTVGAAYNYDTEDKTATVTLMTAASRISFAVVTLTQVGSAYITLESDSVTFDYEGGTVTCEVASNFDWEVEYDTSNGWLTAANESGSLVLTAAANDGDDSRETVLTLTAGDGADNTAEAVLTVVQNPFTTDALILTYTITDAGTTVQLPLAGMVNCTVDWGDGSEQEHVNSTLPEHTYADAGEYDVTIDGTVSQLSSSGIASVSKPNTTLTAVKSWGYTGLASMASAFYYCEGLKSVPTDNTEAFVDVESFKNAFYFCEALESIPAKLFQYASKATSFNHCFNHCLVMESIPAGLLDNCTSASDLYYIFSHCDAVPEIPAGLFDHISPAADIRYAFSYNYALTSIPAGLFDNLTETTSFDHVFYSCKMNPSIPAGLFDKNVNVTSFADVFYNNAITEIPEGLFDNCPEVTDFTETFFYCQSLASVPESLFAKNTKATNFTGTLRSTAITDVPAGLFANCPDVTSFKYIFFSGKFEEIPAGIFDNNLKVTDFSYAFQSCGSLTGESPYTVLSDGTKVHLYERADHTSDMGCVAPTSYNKCFTSCTKMADYNDVPTAWK